MWQTLNESLEPHGLVMLAIALDEDFDAVRHWARDEPAVPLTFPVLIDQDHLVAERYGIVNVPTTVWIDEQRRIVRPPAIAPADDTFRDFTHIDSSIHQTALRRWVLDDVAPLSAPEIEARRPATDPDAAQARTERRLAMHLFRAGDRTAAERHLATALDLAPNDWTINRGSMPIRGQDPFGQEFMDFYQSWEAAGRPGSGA